MKSYLVAYDIFDNKRRYEVAKVVEAYKLEGQKSSWETPLDRKSMKSMVQELEKNILKEDKINIVAVVGKPILLGKAKSIELQRGGIVVNALLSF